MKKYNLYYFEMQLRTRDFVLALGQKTLLYNIYVNKSEVFVWQQPEQLCAVPLHICIRKVIAHLHKEAGSYYFTVLIN